MAVFTSHGKMSEEQKKRISKNWDFILDNVDPLEILQYFIQEGIFGLKERDRIMSYNPNTRHNKNCEFFSLLFQSTSRAYEVLLLALDASGFKFVADKIRNTVVNEKDAIIDPSSRLDAIKHVTQNLSGEYVQCGDNCTMNVTINRVDDKLQKLIAKTQREIVHWKTEKVEVFTETPALRHSLQKLENDGTVTLLGQSGDGKTSVGYSLLDRSNRTKLIIRQPSDWEEVDVEEEQIIMIDDMLGRHVLDKIAKNNWVKKLQNMYACVKGEKIQLVITSRTTVFSSVEKELQAYDLFHPSNVIHLSGPKSESGLDAETKLTILKKYIKSKFAMPGFSICNTPGEECLSSPTCYGRRISELTLQKISKKQTVLGFPQCCRVFVSKAECITRGDKFFDQPTEHIIKEINRMSESDNKLDRFNYCTLACVLIFEELTVDIIESEMDTVRQVADACEINITDVSLKRSASRLTTSYLVYSGETCGFTFQHNSLLEAVFTSFFQLKPHLLLKHCTLDLVGSLITTQNAKEKSSLFCILQGGNQMETMCERLAKEILTGQIEEVVSHRVFTDEAFADRFCSYIETSEQATAILQSTAPCWMFGKPVSVFVWSCWKSDECFVKPLLRVLRATLSNEILEKEMSDALSAACMNGNQGAYKLLISQPGLRIDPECLWMAGQHGEKEGDEIVNDLLALKKWSTEDVNAALTRVCRFGSYETYRSLVQYDAKAACDMCLYWAAYRGATRILDDLLIVRAWSIHDIGKALGTACIQEQYESVESLIQHNPKAVDLFCLLWAICNKGTNILESLLKVRSWKTRQITDALERACNQGQYEAYKLLTEYDPDALGDNCVLEAVNCKDSRILHDLESKGYKV